MHKTPSLRHIYSLIFTFSYKTLISKLFNFIPHLFLCALFINTFSTHGPRAKCGPRGKNSWPSTAPINSVENGPRWVFRRLCIWACKCKSLLSVFDMYNYMYVHVHVHVHYMCSTCTQHVVHMCIKCISICVFAEIG